MKKLLLMLAALLMSCSFALAQDQSATTPDNPQSTTTTRTPDITPRRDNSGNWGWVGLLGLLGLAGLGRRSAAVKETDSSRFSSVGTRSKDARPEDVRRIA